MRLSLNQFMRSIALGGLVVSAAALGANAQESVGADYGAREPATCEDRTQPEEGPPTREQLHEHLRCTMEGIGDGRLYLVENLEAEVTGEGRPFDPQSDYYDNIDREALIYPIGGSLLRYNCHALDGINHGASCETFEEDAATGVCYKMTSGEWNCRMSDLSQVRTEGVPPPQ